MTAAIVGPGGAGGAGAGMERARALETLGIEAGEREERFDRITRLARRLFGVEIAAVTLLDEDTQWVKSESGYSGAEPVPVEDAMCRVTLGEPTARTVVEDTRVDPRFARNRFVVGEPNVRFYAGEALTTASGTRVGTLCLFDSRPRTFTATDVAILHELAAWAETELQRSAEMDRAAEVQRALLPGRGTVDLDGYEVTGSCVPARAVGGDLLDWYRLPPDDGGEADVVLTLGDVMGKGIGAALLMATVRSALRTAGRRAGPAEAVRQAALALEADLEGTGTLVTLCHARLSPQSGVLRWADAGHGLMLLVRADGTVLRPGPGGLPLGVLPDDRWPEERVALGPGDLVVAFSDGLLDLFPTAEAAFAEVASLVTADPAGCVAELERRAREAALPDDVTCLVVRRCR
jgi:hypothetical protein